MSALSTKKVEIWVYPKGKYVGTFYPSITSAANALDLQASHICEVLLGKRSQHKGYTFQPVYYGYYERRRK